MLRRSAFPYVLVLSMLAPLAANTALGQANAGPGADAPGPITVAVREVAPFAMRDGSGGWQGLSVDLWQEVADRRNIDFEYVEATLEDTITGLENGDIDAAVAAISVTADREAILDFSHPYYVTGLALAIPARGESAWLRTLKGFFSLEFLSAVGSLAFVLLIAGFFIWLFERKANAEEFGHGDVKRGLGDGFWWSAVTMTTVGYGDKAPKTPGGRFVALIWMFVSLIIIASFTASIAASLTTNNLVSATLRDRPMSELEVGVLAGSAAEAFAANQGAAVRPFESVTTALDALDDGQVDAVLHDSPILRYQVRESALDVQVANRVLVRDDYAFAFPEGSPIRNETNLALLDVLFADTWNTIRARYVDDAS